MVTTKGAYDASDYWDRRLARRWDLRGVGLKGYSLAYNRWLYRVRAVVFRRTVRQLPIAVKGAKVLEVGPGVGFYTRRWIARGAEVTAIEIAASAVGQLNLRLPDANVIQGDIGAEVPVVPGAFDIAAAFDVLFHIVDDDRYDQAIANIASALRPGGWFLFTDCGAKHRRQPMKHYVRRSLDETMRALDAAGFELVSCRPAFVLMQNPFDGSAAHRRWWRRVNPALRRPTTGALLGAALCGPELVLTRTVRTAPSTKVFLCRKRP